VSSGDTINTSSSKDPMMNEQSVRKNWIFACTNPSYWSTLTSFIAESIYQFYSDPISTYEQKNTEQKEQRIRS
jgi:hypothetical protein